MKRKSEKTDVLRCPLDQFLEYFSELMFKALVCFPLLPPRGQERDTSLASLDLGETNPTRCHPPPRSSNFQETELKERDSIK